MKKKKERVDGDLGIIGRRTVWAEKKGDAGRRLFRSEKPNPGEYAEKGKYDSHKHSGSDSPGQRTSQ